MIPLEIRKSSRSVRNRVQSILSDSEFVLAVKEVYDKPLVANKRCGLWYVPSDHLEETCYFKSTDGHSNQWNFSVRRLNLHLLKVMEENEGVIIVDSTRKGKSMPDAFSKTIPIWCAVLNRALFGIQDLYLPRNIISQSERQQISDRMDNWVDMLKSTVPDESSYHLSKPLRPIWVTQEGLLPIEKPHFERFFPVILCTASERVQDGLIQRAGYSYVQGAGDDHELWAGKLTPEMFWSHGGLQGDLSEHDLMLRIEEISSGVPAEAGVPLSLTPYLSVGRALSDGPVIDLRSLSTGKRGARELSTKLGSVDAEFARVGPKVCILTKELEIGVAVCLLLSCLYFDDEGNPRSRSKATSSKEEVAKRLVPLAETGRCLPSRATLNIIGSYLRE